MSKDRTRKGTAVSQDKKGDEMKEAVEIQTESGDKDAETEADEQDNAAPVPEMNPELKIEELQKELSDLKDQYLRKQADFENFRKRMFREKEEAIKFANSNLIMDLIPIIDDFERAIRSGEDSQDFSSFHQGIELIEKQFIGMLDRKWGLKRFDSGGDDFDPERHEALLMEESDEVEKPKVVEDFQKGYMLHDRVLRHAKVKVHMPKADAAENEEDDD